MSNTTDHPRACGENMKGGGAPDAIIGSPPRMRGKPHIGDVDKVFQRITPAHAGKTPLSFSSHSLSTDHPRACGENLLEQPFFQRLDGSPPRMRGKLSPLSRIHPGNRITPAHAGKTQAVSGIDALSADHPRACGENLQHTF